MSHYMTEEEQVEAIKAFLKRHYRFILVLLGALMFSIMGYQYWQQHHAKILTEASATYDALVFAVADNERPKIHAYANRLIQSYDKTVYADAARLLLAKSLVGESQFDKALTLLSVLSVQGHLPALQQLAKLRMARLLVHAKKYEEALKALSGLDDSVYAPLALELKGDIFVQTHDLVQAKKAYEAARQSGKKGTMSSMLEVKLQEV